MTKATPQSTRDYLSQLDAALVGVEPDVRSEILAGIREELDGLDAEAAAARIRTLGDPAFIAAEAKAATPTPERTSPAEPPPGRTLAIVAVLLVIVGAFVIPVIGPLVGLVWISFSAVWTRWEKIAAWLAPIVVSLTFVLVGAISGAVQQNAATEAVNPLLPLGNLGGWHVAILLPYFVLPIVGIVLLMKANNRGWRR